MKADIHPKYEPVIFQDVSSNFAFLTRSTMTSKDKMKWEDGKEYPLVKVHITSQSHPFFTGEERIVDIEGRVDKFKARAEAAQQAREARMHAAKKVQARAAAKAEKAEAKKSTSK